MGEIYQYQTDSMGTNSIKITTGKIYRDKDNIDFTIQIINFPNGAQISLDEEEAKKLATAILDTLNAE
ncbi:MAG TPA: hypothetical protein VF556_16915 [Pyrinomonadaceae bacterium]|jgi:hypothetical protein